jgi:hypothetical protein
MPFREVGGLKYSFAGQLWRNGRWHDFALCDDMRTVDSVVAQVDAGFTFGNPDPKYADKNAQLARALNFMTHDADPNGDQPAVGLRSGNWVTLMPG